MARARNIKPGFFRNEDLVELGFATRLLFAGLWTIADREGRLEDRPKKIKMDVFPADDVNIDAMLQELHDAKFVLRYEVDGVRYVQITNWSKHQNPHHTEKASVIPGPNGELTVKAPLEPKEQPKQDGGNLADSLIPDSLIPDTNNSSPDGDGDETGVSPPAGANGVQTSRQTADNCPHQAIIDLYHQTLPTGRQVREWTPARQAMLRSRWRENPKRQTLDWWGRYFAYCAKSKFLTGQTHSPGRRPFELSLDWLVKPENMAKVIEGAYHEAETEAA